MTGSSTAISPPTTAPSAKTTPYFLDKVTAIRLLGFTGLAYDVSGALQETVLIARFLPQRKPSKNGSTAVAISKLQPIPPLLSPNALQSPTAQPS
ncbi:MAG: hypothetical protein ACLQO7_11240 [Candidatus Bathyarchaeia archaeon]